MKKLIILSLLVGLLQSCSTVKTYKLNTAFDIILDNEAAGGFQWHYKETPQVVKVDSVTITISDEGKLNSYKKRFTLKGVEKGRYELFFFQQQPFNILDSIPEEYIKRIKIRIKN